MEIISILIAIILAVLAEWFKTRCEVRKKALGYINQAETDFADMSKSGGAKFSFVVNSLYRLIPSYLKWLITKNEIEEIVQKTFDQMKKFALEQLDQLLQEEDEKV